MRPFIKICCIASVEEANLAVQSGADAIGLVSAMPSGPGVIDEHLIAEIAAATPDRIETYLLTALKEADDIFSQHTRCQTTALQLVEDVEFMQLVKLRNILPRVKLVKVIHVVGPESVALAKRVEPYVDALLLDSGSPLGATKALGGTGRTHDWLISREICVQAKKPVFLAGGLNSKNAAAALATVNPYGVDVCSGVRTDGKLDSTKLAAFIATLNAEANP
jgi:phosphoribosylanthranilate isomerase